MGCISQAIGRGSIGVKRFVCVNTPPPKGCGHRIANRNGVTREDFGAAYEQGSRRTVRFLRSRGVPLESAQDIAQTAWLRGWERLYQLRDEKLLGTWINTIALNTYRRAIFRDRMVQQLSESSRAETFIGETFINEASIDLNRLINNCRPADRSSLEAQLAGITPKEIATADGVSQVAIRVRFARARRAVRLGLQAPPAPRKQAMAASY